MWKWLLHVDLEDGDTFNAPEDGDEAANTDCRHKLALSLS